MQRIDAKKQEKERKQRQQQQRKQEKLNNDINKLQNKNIQNMTTSGVTKDIQSIEKILNDNNNNLTEEQEQILNQIKSEMQQRKEHLESKKGGNSGNTGVRQSSRLKNKQKPNMAEEKTPPVNEEQELEPAINPVIRQLRGADLGGDEQEQQQDDQEQQDGQPDGQQQDDQEVQQEQQQQGGHQEILQLLQGFDIKPNQNKGGNLSITFGGIYNSYQRIPIITIPTIENYDLFSSLIDFIKVECNKEIGIDYSAITINKNYQCGEHRDRNNMDGKPSIIIGLGDYTGGALCIEDENGNTTINDIQDKWLQFDGHNKHWVQAFDDERYSLIYFFSKQTEIMINEYIHQDYEIKDVNGLKVKTRKNTSDETVINEVLVQDVYLKDIEMNNLNIRDAVVLDIGGNIGTFALRVANEVKQVKVFEPEPVNATICRNNVLLNGLKNVQVFQKGVTYSGNEKILYLCNGEYNKYQHSIFDNQQRRKNDQYQ